MMITEPRSPVRGVEKSGGGPKGPVAARLFIMAGALLLLAGCAHFSSRQIETAPDGTQRVTRIAVTTFFDAHNDLTKLRASTTDKTQGMSIAGISESASSTNAVEILRLVTALVGAVAK